MASPDKVAAVSVLTEEFRSSNAVVFTEYRGLSVKRLQELRRSLGAEASYAVAKNTLTKIAASDAGLDSLDEYLTGPTAIAFIKGDVAGVAKRLKEFAKANPLLVIKGGVMDGKVLDAETVRMLADLESREVLLSKLAGALKGSAQKAVSLFAAPLTQAAQLMGALEAKAQDDPSVIGGAGSAPVAVQEPVAAEEAASEADQAEEIAAEAATEAADAAEATTDAADAASND